MAEVWIYVVGSIIAAVIAFTIAVSIYSSSITYSENQNMLKKFSEFYSTAYSLCLQEINSSQEFQIILTSNVRLLYATEDTENAEIKVVDKIKNQTISSGQNLCMQFKSERRPRCFSETSNLLCTFNMPHLGVLPETEDIWVKVRKVLGFSTSRDYSLLVKKVGAKEVNITVV